MSRRVLVPDTSVLVAAHFPEQSSRQAERLVRAIYSQQVTAFAPCSASNEFLKTALEKCASRSSAQRVALQIATDQVQRFFQLGLTMISTYHLQEQAWVLMSEHQISPPDSWFLACAMMTNAELWLTHDHRDGFVEAARRVHNSDHTLDRDSGILS